MNAHRIGIALLIMSLIAASAPLRGQSCNDPLTVCPEEPTSLFITEAAFLNFDCIDATHVAVIKFRSNHNFENPGNARVRITQVTC